MKKNRLTAIFDTYRDASTAAERVRRIGFDTNKISIIGNHDENQYYGTNTVNDNISDGATTGTLIGGAAGLVLGLGTIAVPGLGVIAAAGPIAGLLSGAVTGGIAGSLIDLGIPESKAKNMEQSIHQGKYLWSMELDSNDIETVRNILRECGSENEELS